MSSPRIANEQDDKSKEPVDEKVRPESDPGMTQVDGNLAELDVTLGDARGQAGAGGRAGGRMRTGGDDAGACFPAGTLILTPAGERDIATLHPNELVVSIAADGQVSHRRLLRVVTHAPTSLWELKFSDGSRLKTTRVHSFLIAGTWQRADAIQAGDPVGTLAGGRLIERTVEHAGPLGESASVYNLIVEGEYTFIANGAVAHSFTRFRRLQMLAWTLLGKIGSIELRMTGRRLAA
jgi:hypothetical protein